MNVCAGVVADQIVIGSNAKEFSKVTEGDGGVGLKPEVAMVMCRSQITPFTVGERGGGGSTGRVSLMERSQIIPSFREKWQSLDHYMLKQTSFKAELEYYIISRNCQITDSSRATAQTYQCMFFGEIKAQYSQMKLQIR